MVFLFSCLRRSGLIRHAVTIHKLTISGTADAADPAKSSANVSTLRRRRFILIIMAFRNQHVPGEARAALLLGSSYPPEKTLICSEARHSNYCCAETSPISRKILLYTRLRCCLTLWNEGKQNADCRFPGPRLGGQYS